ncbi:translation initiation factor IF-2-like [Equus quagga]|uniref:translation initiation factor IF-2-like n=1 Tax=Equus quagga TaxID=89248 RepID=UPI001EE1E7E9|nr:translation initiation factor IF-2-like [Equus quagga]
MSVQCSATYQNGEDSEHTGRQRGGDDGDDGTLQRGPGWAGAERSGLRNWGPRRLGLVGPPAPARPRLGPAEDAAPLRTGRRAQPAAGTGRSHRAQPAGGTGGTHRGRTAGLRRRPAGCGARSRARRGPAAASALRPLSLGPSAEGRSRDRPASARAPTPARWRDFALGLRGRSLGGQRQEAGEASLAHVGGPPPGPGGGEGHCRLALDRDRRVGGRAAFANNRPSGQQRLGDLAAPVPEAPAPPRPRALLPALPSLLAQRANSTLPRRLSAVGVREMLRVDPEGAFLTGPAFPGLVGVAPSQARLNTAT